jgi:hypothetical protein
MAIFWTFENRDENFVRCKDACAPQRSESVICNALKLQMTRLERSSFFVRAKNPQGLYRGRNA